MISQPSLSLFFGGKVGALNSIAVKVWHAYENVMYLPNTCDHVITYANVETIFKARRAPNSGFVCIVYTS